MSDENLYTKILRWGYDRVDAGVTHEEFKIFLSSLNVEIGEQRQDAIFRELFDHVEKNLTTGAIPVAMRNNECFRLNLEGMFHHLERVELLEARSGSQKAMNVAIGSILLAALIGIAQIVVAVTGC